MCRIPATSQVIASILFYIGCIKELYVFPFFLFTVHNRGGRSLNNGRGWVWQPVGTSGLPSWLVALVCMNTFFIQTKPYSPKTPYVFTSCRCNSKSSQHNGRSKSGGSALSVQALPLQGRRPIQILAIKGSSVSWSKPAKRYLYMPATSLSCERVFSNAGEVVSNKRNRLKPNCSEMILFLNKNL